MSQAHTAAALQIRGLEPTSKLLLLTLCLGADRQGRGEAMPAELANMTGLSERTIRDHMRKLWFLGLIDRERYDTRYQLSLVAIVQPNFTPRG